MCVMKPLILYPCNGHAREALAVVEALNKGGDDWKVLGFIDDDPARTGERAGAYSILGTPADLPNHPDAFVVAVPGRPDNYWQRLDKIAALGIPPERMPALVHPAATVGPDCSLSHNTVLMAGVVLTTSVRIGPHVGILPNTVLSHDVTVGEGTLIGAGVAVAGGVQLGSCCYIGSGCHILQDVIVGDGALVGLGSTILHSVPPQTVVAGNPGRLLRAIPSETA